MELLELLTEKERRLNEIDINDPRMKDKWWRMNNLYYIINENAEKILFQPKLRDVQTALFNDPHNRKLVLKARQHGVTTYYCIDYLDNAMFKKNISCGIIAHNKDDAQIFFADKVKYAFDNLRCPELIVKLAPSKDSSRELVFANNSSIRVGTSLRSTTLQYLHISEYGKICAKYPEKAREIRTGALNTVHGNNEITIESTAEGRDGDFYRMCTKAQNNEKQGKELTQMDFKPFFFSWFQKPEYRLDIDSVSIPPTMIEYFMDLYHKHGIKLDDAQRAWYVKKYETQQDEMKREFPSTPEEAFEAAIIGAYYGVQMARVREQRRLGAFPHNPNALVYTGWDIGYNDAMTIWFFQLDNNMVNIIDYYENSGEEMGHYVELLKEKGYIYGDHYAPHDISKHDVMSGKTRIRRAKEDFDISFIRIERAMNVVEDINEVRRMFYKFRFNEVTTERGVAALDNYRKEWNEHLVCFRKTPLHNWASDGADGLRTLTHAVLRLTDYAYYEEEEAQASYKTGRNIHGGY
ncbi:MAG: terminase [Desulfobacterales bacterium]|nr:terminase [Desulfobacterales bacterium]